MSFFSESFFSHALGLRRSLHWRSSGWITTVFPSYSFSSNLNEGPMAKDFLKGIADELPTSFDDSAADSPA